MAESEESVLSYSAGALQYQMDTDVRLTLLKARAFGENRVSKK